MDEYHVSCGLAGIYAGTIKENGKEWLNKTCVTEEAIEAVRDWLMLERGDNKWASCMRSESVDVGKYRLISATIPYLLQEFFLCTIEGNEDQNIAGYESIHQ